MFDLLTEVKKMKTMMGLIKEDQDLESINKHAQNILNILKFSGLYSATIKKLIDKIIKFGETNKMNLFYIRRFIIQPIFLILFIPAFYYQKKIK